MTLNLCSHDNKPFYERNAELLHNYTNNDISHCARMISTENHCSNVVTDDLFSKIAYIFDYNMEYTYLYTQHTQTQQYTTSTTYYTTYYNDCNKMILSDILCISGTFTRDGYHVTR